MKKSIFHKALGYVMLTATATFSFFPQPLSASCLDALQQSLNKRLAFTPNQACTKIEKDLGLWFVYQSPKTEAPFEDIVAFIIRHPRWPSLEAMRKNAELRLDDEVDAQAVASYFQKFKPLTWKVVLYAARLALTDGNEKKAAALIQKAWPLLTMTADQQRTFLEQAGVYLSSADHIKRADALLWEGRLDEAGRVIPLVPASRQKPFKVRLALQQKSGDTSGLTSKDYQLEGVSYDVCNTYRKGDRYDEALAVLKATKMAGGYHDKWWMQRHHLARELLKEKKVQQAYNLVAHHGMTSGANFAEAEWFAGFLALRLMDKPALAGEHFQRFLAAVRSPVSQSRGYYWLARVAEQENDLQAARDFYEKASHFKTCFYGQLSAGKLGINDLPKLTRPSVSAKAKERFEKDTLVQTIKLLKTLGGPAHSAMLTFCTGLGGLAGTKEEKVLAFELMSSVLPAEAIFAGHKINLDAPGVYPVRTDIQAHTVLKDHALVHSLIHQESRFNAGAVSSADAKGLMQLMLATAKKTAKKMGVSLKESDLIQKPAMNVRIGSSHLKELIDYYGGSYYLAIAAYNAGTTPVDRWLSEIGDPRQGQIDLIDFLELITYGETRNYVQRVMEKIPLYRDRMKSEPLTLTHDLQR